ncbi:MAG: hypothetical protein JSW22_07930 [Chloroflexota bacterium]|nr:MAG: hypothetical protein JSW22_07930 [Chloroflexota bacterium]
MKRKIFSIWSIVLVLVVSLAVLVPGCEGEGQTTTGTIDVAATLDGSPWAGSVSYTLTPDSGSPVNGASVPGSHTEEAGNWTCGYVSGGPPGADFVGITPSASQELSAGGTIGFTLNFETPPPPPDASVVFKTWTINGMPVDPAHGPFPVGPGDWIDVEFEEHVSGGQEGEVVTVHQTSWLFVHNWGYEGDPGPSIWLHVVNAPGAVSMDPPAEDKSNQQCTLDGIPVNPCDEIELPYCEEIALDMEVDWDLKICTNYTKTINWIGFDGGVPMTLANGAEVLFDVTLIDPFQCLTLIAQACVQVDGDENHDNDCTELSPPLDICYMPPL